MDIAIMPINLKTENEPTAIEKNITKDDFHEKRQAYFQHAFANKPENSAERAIHILNNL